MRRMYSQKQLEKIVDNVVEEKDITPVSGTSDGTNWTSLTVGDETHGFAAGGDEKIVYVNNSTTAQELAAILNDNLIPVFKTTTPQGETWCLPLVHVSQYFYDFGAIQNDRWYYCRFSISTDRWEGIYSHMAIPLNGMPSNTQGTYMLECSVDEYGYHNYHWTNTPTIPDAVSGTNDGTNWTSLTIGDTTKAIPSASGSGLIYKEIVVRDWNVSGDITSQFTQSQLADMYRNPENYIVRVRKDTTNVAHYAYLVYNNHVGELTPATQKYVWWDTNYEIATQASPPKLWNHGKFEIGYKSEGGVFSYYAYFYARIEYTLSN